MEPRIDGAGFSWADELVGEGRMRRGRKRATRTSEAGTRVGQVTRGANELVRQGDRWGRDARGQGTRSQLFRRRRVALLS